MDQAYPDPYLKKKTKPEKKMKQKYLFILLIILNAFGTHVVHASFITPVTELNSQPIYLAATTSATLNNAVRSIKQQHGGKVLSAKTVVVNGQKTHKIKILLPSGKVRVFKVKAQ